MFLCFLDGSLKDVLWPKAHDNSVVFSPLINFSRRIIVQGGKKNELKVFVNRSIQCRSLTVAHLFKLLRASIVDFSKAPRNLAIVCIIPRSGELCPCWSYGVLTY